MRHVRFEQAAPPREHFFDRKDPWGHGLSLWVVALLIFLAPVAIFSLRHLRLDNEVEHWLPANDPAAMEYAWCRKHFPEQEILFLTWDGSTVDDPRLPILVGQLQGKVDEDGIRRGGLPYVASVMTAGDMLARMQGFGIEPEEALRRLQGTVVGRGWPKVRLTPAALQHKDQAVARLFVAAKNKFGIVMSLHEPVGEWTPPLEVKSRFVELRDRFASISDEAGNASAPELGQHDLQVSWPGLAANESLLRDFLSWVKTVTDASGNLLVQDCYLAPGSPIAVVIALSEAGIAEKPTALAAIRQAATDAFVPAGDVVLGGRVVSAAELNAGVIRAAWNPHSKSLLTRSVILLSGLVGIIFAFISLKSIRLGLLVVGVSYYAALLGMAVVPLSGGSMNMVLVVMPTLLMVLSLSGAIHIANYWKHAVWEDPSTAVSKAVKMAAEPCLLAAFTTALGLVSLAGSQLAPVREFGIYSSIGSLISVAMILYGLPALLQMTPIKRIRPEEVNPWFWRFYGDWTCRRWRSVMFCSILVPVICGLGLQWFRVETKVIRYFPAHSQLVRDFQKMEDSLTGICPVEVVVRFNAQAQSELRFLERMEIVRQIEEEVRRHPEVSGTLSLADFQPVREPPVASASAREKILYNRRSHESEERIKSGKAAGAAELVTMTRTSPLPGDAPRVDPDELWRINAQCAILSDVNYDTLTRELQDCVQRVAGKHAGIDQFVTGTVPLFLRTQRAVLDSLIWSFVMAFGLIALVMVWVLKDPIAGLISMVPNVLPVLSVFGLVSWCGQKIDIGTMVTASVALGIAVDGTLHLLTWFQDGLRRGLTRQQSIVAALAHCGPAMWQTSAAVGIGLLVLFPADLLLISRFGWLMAALIGAALLGDVVLLPSLLMGSLGALIERGLRRRGEIPAPAGVNAVLPAAQLKRAMAETRAVG